MRGCHAEAQTEAAVSEVWRETWSGNLLSPRGGDCRAVAYDVLLVPLVPDITEKERDRCACC